VGKWRDFWLGSPPAAPAIQSPWAPTDVLTELVADDFLTGLSESGVVTRDIALRVPGVKRAHGIHCSIVAGLNWYVMDGDVRAADQPGWLTNSASGVAPYHRSYGVVSDLFMQGWACLGFADDMSDALHIPNGFWSVNDAGGVEVDERIPALYRQRPIAIPLGYGDNGIMIDGVDSIRAARNIDRAWMERVENPLPATDLHLTDPAYNGMTKREKRKIVDEWNENRARAGGQTAVTQSFVEVRALGQTSADLFEKGRNAVRLDLANHAAVPASIIEGARDGGGSDINYSSEATESNKSRNELYDFGTSRFVRAIEARLSLDDVCAPGLSIRADLSSLMAAPSPATNLTSED
jgi:hypothetical protein